MNCSLWNLSDVHCTCYCAVIIERNVSFMVVQWCSKTEQLRIEVFIWGEWQLWQKALFPSLKETAFFCISKNEINNFFVSFNIALIYETICSSSPLFSCRTTFNFFWYSQIYSSFNTVLNLPSISYKNRSKSQRSLNKN